MKAIQVTELGQPPKLIELDSPIVVGDAPEMVDVKLVASGVHGLVRSRAAGKHYSAKGLPHTPGVDGVFETPDGNLFYAAAISPRGGTMVEELKLPKRNLTPLPKGTDPVQAAGLVNPIMASWLALATRVTNLPENFTCVIVGATTLSGICAITVAREYGAGKVIGVARNPSKMEGLGLDHAIKLEDDVEKTDFSALPPVDVILDFLFGPIIPHLFRSLVNPPKVVQYVQIGSVASLTAELPADQLRSKNIVMSGSGPGAWSLQQLAQETPNMVNMVHKIKPYKFQTVPLAKVEETWNKVGDRLVVVP